MSTTKHDTAQAAMEQACKAYDDALAPARTVLEAARDAKAAALKAHTAARAEYERVESQARMAFDVEWNRIHTVLNDGGAA